MTDDQLQSVTIMMWRQYLLHDELLSAISFLERAPVNVRDAKATQEALTTTKKMAGWLNDPKLMQKHNASETIDVEIDVPMPFPLANNQSGGRFRLITDHLPAHKVSMVDFGCADGCFTNRYGLIGHEVYGLDVVESFINLANKKAQEFNTGVKYVNTYFQDAVNKVPNDYFDYATSTDTYEHLNNPVKDMLLPAKKILNDDGKFLLCTPYGAWMRGNFLPWAEPWQDASKGHSWLYPSAHKHLVAPTPWSVANDFYEAGYYVKNCYPVLCQPADVPNQGNVFVEACVKAPNNYPGLDIVFAIGDGIEEWTPETVKKNGIGGSELMCLELSKRLASLGHRVRVFNSCGPHGSGIYDGVEYHPSSKYQNIDCDVLVVSRQAPMLGDQYNVQAKLKLLWVHDIYAMGATPELLLKADRILALSAWHKQNIINTHHVHPNQVIQTRNGIDLTRFDKQVVRNRYRVVNSSSPDRSWPALLNYWPEIKQRVPQAELHLFYGFKNWEYVAKYYPGQPELIERLKAQVESLKPLGVVYHDRVNQAQLAEEFLQSGMWGYPSFFTETSCLTAMEAQASGLRIVTSSIAALNETVGPRGVLIDGDWLSQPYQKQFVDAVVEALNKEDDSDRATLQQYAREHFGLDELAKDWETMFYQLIEEVKIHPFLPYV
jgi:2-polyprenyl-3-methyl-5-hydroxy-6-metoxy-1,4-benzoquinol methylase/glycosyltransferase involved in cell wall biosynthesis